MRNITRVKWFASDVEHIAKHGVSPWEVEQTAFEDDVYIRTGSNNLHYLFGATQAGRYLFIVVAETKRLGEVKVVTARDMNVNERKYYKKRGK